LDNQFLLSNDKYPKTLSGALKFPKTYKVPICYQQPHDKDNNNNKAGLVFINTRGGNKGGGYYNPNDVAYYGCDK